MTKVLVRSSVWGCGRAERFVMKQNLKHRFAYPFLDHTRIFAWKTKGKRGPCKETESLLVAYPYKDAVDAASTWDTFVEAAHDIGLRVVRERVSYGGQRAYRIIVADRDVDVTLASARFRTQTRDRAVRPSLCGSSSRLKILHTANKENDCDQTRSSIVGTIETTGVHSREAM